MRIIYGGLILENKTLVSVNHTRFQMLDIRSFHDASKNAISKTMTSDH